MLTFSTLAIFQQLDPNNNTRSFTYVFMWHGFYNGRGLNCGVKSKSLVCDCGLREEDRFF